MNQTKQIVDTEPDATATVPVVEPTFQPSPTLPHTQSGPFTTVSLESLDRSGIAEFRQDLVSGEWVLFSTERSRRLEEIKTNEIFYASKKTCPFEDPIGTKQEIVWGYPDNNSWEVMVIKNKYPAVKPGVCGDGSQMGPFLTHPAIGSHDVIVSKDHDIQFSDFTVEQTESIIKVYKKRYKEIVGSKGCLRYIMIFHNFRKEAGASIYHPHSQIISTPILPPGVTRSIYGSYKFFAENKKRVYDVIIDWEKEQNKRIVYENDFFVAFCPFVSRIPYEVRIFSKDSHAHFELMPDELDKYLADALSAVLKMMKKVLHDPPFNYFIHTAPVEVPFDSNVHEFYHWHVEVLPKTSVMAGFEMGTGIVINVVDPDEAAEQLRSAG